MHNDFTLFWRKVPSGKMAVYYYAYDENEVRRGPWTTGENNKTAARNYCNKLIRDGKLIPNRLNSPTFEEYAVGWWEWETCPYLKKRKKRHNLTQAYADLYKRQMNNHLIPCFGKMKLDKITPDVIENWLDDMAEKGYKNTYTNGIFGTLKNMMIEAAAWKLILVTPTANIEKLVNDRKEIRIITPDEFRALFLDDWKRVWNNNRITYLANKLAALTGMRSCEVLGLRGEYVFEDHIYLCAQFDEYGYRPTKTKIKHNIPLAPGFIGELRELMIMNGKGFIFSLDGGAAPVTRKSMYDDFHSALTQIGISREEISERKLHLHAWRHFCNTELLKAGVAIQKVQSVTGHKTERMTEMYSHFDPNEFSEVRKVQEDLLRPAGTAGKNPQAAEPKNRGTARKTVTGKAAKQQPLKLVTQEKRKPGGKIIPMPEQKAGRVRKQA
jgi:integrase